MICAIEFELEKVIFACLTGALVTAAANAINDYYDLDIDRVNKPKRPIPKGIVTLKEAKAFAFLCFFGGMICSSFINLYAAGIALIFSILLYFYSARFKRTVLFGNFVVSLATAFAFIFGGVTVNKPFNALIPALFAFLMHFGREIIKDMEDIIGDMYNNARTLPVQYGFKTSQWIVTILFFILILATFLPYFSGFYGKWYFMLVIPGVDIVLLYSIISMWKNPSRNNYHKLSTLLKADMLVGLFAIYAGRW